MAYDYCSECGKDFKGKVVQKCYALLRGKCCICGKAIGVMNDDYGVTGCSSPEDIRSQGFVVPDKH